MRLAFIDIGSNTIKMTVFSSGPQLKEIFSKTLHARLSSYVENGRLTESGIRRLILSVGALRRSARRYLCKKQNVFAFATACVRNAENRADVLDRAERSLKMKIDLLSGEREAELCFRGASILAGFPSDGILADLGGGSCEFISFENKRIIKKVSLNIGALANYRRFVKGEYITESEAAELSEYLKNELSTLKRSLAMPKGGEIVITGGSARALVKLVSAIESGDSSLPFTITKERAEEICKKCASGELVPLTEKLLRERAKIIPCACAVFSAAADTFARDSFTVVCGGAREGYADSLING